MVYRVWAGYAVVLRAAAFPLTFQPSDSSDILPIVLFPCSFDSITQTHRTHLSAQQDLMSGPPCCFVVRYVFRHLVLLPLFYPTLKPPCSPLVPN
ncbi:hypothetical protein JB92DRAFT_2879185 [Gautieria morchelliformis]|nr:hypothetical protein JB92DRAFT_2879185 [Gautieria morchelliformis]